MPRYYPLLQQYIAAEIFASDERHERAEYALSCMSEEEIAEYQAVYTNVEELFDFLADMGG